MRVKVINQVKAIQKRLTFALLFIVCNILLCAFVRGLDRDRTIIQFHHTAWTAKELAPGHIRSIAQTNDGYLWLGTATGLYRFDGVTFERFVPWAGNNLISNDIYNLLATPDGGLWISYFFGGASFLKDGILTNYADVDGLPAVQNFARDDEGNI